MRFFIFVFTFLLFSAIFQRNLIYAAVVILAGIIVLSIFILHKKMLISKTKKAVKEIKDKGKTELKPFINVNRACWEVFQEIPGFNRVSAKKCVWLRKKFGYYQSIDDFLKRNSIVDMESIFVINQLVKHK